MVSLRRRRLLGLCSGKSSFPIEPSQPTESEDAAGILNQNTKSFSVHPMSVNDFSDQKMINNSEACNEVSITPGSNSSKDPNPYFPGKQIKHRKRHRRKPYEHKEPCIMRGVYFKNMKWQAAIKVDKKQIHLGTFGSQEEAARLYDRAAFMCGREPNFELVEEEKQELSQYKWGQFLAITRDAITNKKHQKSFNGGRQIKPETDVDDGERDADEDEDEDEDYASTSVS